jgi:hypothetical protein
VLKASAPLAPNLNAAATVAKVPQWSWTSGGGGNGTYRTKLDAGAYPTTGGSGTSSSPTGLTDGSHTLCVEEQDVVGWGAERCLAITVDNTAPALAITSSTDPKLLITSVNPVIAGTASDNNFTSLSYTINGGTPTNITRTGNNWSFTASYPDGDLTVAITAKDAAANQTTVSVVIHKMKDVIFVRQGNANGNGNSWATAYGELSDVMDGLKGFSGKKIWVSAGLYIPNTAKNYFYADNSASLIGGFKLDGTQFSENQRNPFLDISELTGRTNPTLSITTKNGDPTVGFTLDGFKISNTWISPGASYPGGGIYTSYSTNLLINHCNFIGFTSDIPLYVTGIYGEGVTVRVNKSKFNSNTLSDWAPIALSGAALTIDSSDFTKNTSGGGAVYAVSGSIYSRNSTYINDKLTGSDPVVYSEFHLSDDVMLDIDRCTITNGKAGIIGGTISYGNGNSGPASP